jgi:hypothetical protein
MNEYPLGAGSRSVPVASPLDKQKGVRGVQYVSIKYAERLTEAELA